MRKVKIKLPSSLRDIKLSQYQKFLRVTEGLEDERLIKKRMVAIFCNLTDNIVNAMTPASFEETVSHISNLLNVDDSLPLVRLFRHEGNTHGFIPNMDKLTIGELADIDNNIGDWQKIQIAMGVLYRPTIAEVGEKYKIEPYHRIGRELDVPLDVAFGAYFFLHNLLSDLLNYIPKFIEEIVMSNPESKSLVENGVGLKQFTDSLNALCLDMSRMLQPSNMVKPCFG